MYFDGMSAEELYLLVCQAADELEAIKLIATRKDKGSAIDADDLSAFRIALSRIQHHLTETPTLSYSILREANGDPERFKAIIGEDLDRDIELAPEKSLGFRTLREIYTVSREEFSQLNDPDFETRVANRLGLTVEAFTQAAKKINSLPLIERLAQMDEIIFTKLYGGCESIPCEDVNWTDVQAILMKKYLKMKQDRRMPDKARSGSVNLQEEDNERLDVIDQDDLEALIRAAQERPELIKDRSHQVRKSKH